MTGPADRCGPTQVLPAPVGGNLASVVRQRHAFQEAELMTSATLAASAASATMEPTATLRSSMTHPYLTSKFQVGSAKSDKINYTLAQKVFHSGDVPHEVGVNNLGLCLCCFFRRRDSSLRQVPVCNNF
ncbi:hypothetical protein AK812_SmicGene9586 [Symbiodinium microadriaticum]|uniref:Uncharacterized protein n=1 Tax=Symbiodinium microadriaticum TaxID=2951 RepID=A0A1Q9EI20_SYMMI|nr:hypothetical protein AK812_SmicGene9586 [Symbiodinium microadriaticum]